MDVFIYTFIDGLYTLAFPFARKTTILKRPSMIAINPPVLVPPMRSKYSQGKGAIVALVRRRISSMISRKIKSDDKPRTPPPSSDKIRGLCLISARVRDAPLDRLGCRPMSPAATGSTGLSISMRLGSRDVLNKVQSVVLGDNVGQVVVLFKVQPRPAQ